MEKNKSCFSPVFGRGLCFKKKGFTLIEILVVVLIIGILGAIALPQYQRALLKSRYAALMPIAKSMANSNETYYLEHGIYADDPQDLLIQGQSRYTDDTELEFGTVSDYAYVLAKNEDKIPNNTFVVYQKHSGEFPGEIHCEALANNDLAESVCKSFGGNESIGKTLTDGYETYVLFGTGNGVAPTGDNGGDDEPEESTCPDNSVCDDDGNVTGCSTGYKLSGDTCVEIPPCQGKSCDDNGNITECSSGQTLNNGACEDCATAFPGATSCSTTSYAATACGEGYYLTNGACVAGLDPAIQAKVNAVLASSTCTGEYAGSCHDNGDGTISRCEPGYSTYDAEHNKCMPSYEPKSGYLFPYEYLYNADGKKVEEHRCSTSTSGSKCWGRSTNTFDPATGNQVSYKYRLCQTSNVVMDENFNCANGGTYYEGYDWSFSPTTNKMIAEYNCTYNSDCSTYQSMKEYNDTKTQRRTCKTIKKLECETWNAWESGSW